VSDPGRDLTRVKINMDSTNKKMVMYAFQDLVLACQVVVNSCRELQKEDPEGFAGSPEETLMKNMEDLLKAYEKKTNE
jgi:hypothetical protein